MAKKPKKKENPAGDPGNFEEALEELEAIVEGMEEGEMPLEDSLKAFERGINLTRHCQTALKDAEMKVNILLEKQGKDELQSFQSESDD